MNPLFFRWILLGSLLLSCSPQPPVTPGQAPSSLDPRALQSEIRPGSKGQRLELTSLEGEMWVPAGTSAFTLQSTETRISLLSLLMPPAYAQSSEDGAIELTALQKLEASVNGDPVKLTILSVTRHNNGDEQVKYRLQEVPVSATNVVIEVASPSGAFKLKGLVPKISAGSVSVLSDPLNLDSTALVEVLQQSGEAITDLDADEIRQLQRSQSVQQVRAIIQAHLVEPRLSNNKPQRFEDAVRPLIQAGGQLARFREFIAQRKSCQQRPALCRAALNVLNQTTQVVALSESVQAKIQRRIKLRLQAALGESEPEASAPQASATPSPERTLACLRFPSRPGCSSL